MDLKPELSWSRVATFVRQHTHDVRNHLNGIDLEAALLSEIVTDPEAKTSVDRLRRQLRQMAIEMRTLSGKFTEPIPTKSEVAAHDLFLIWKDQAEAVKPVPKVEWSEKVGDARLSVDVEALAKTFREILTNAVNFGTGQPLHAEAHDGNGKVAFVLEEKKAAEVDPKGWGRTPFASTRRGGYGLGLWESDHAIAASGGEVVREYEPKKQTLITRIVFPTVKG
jgi:hypothetical protein